jgi:hypothetical protein
VVAHIGPFFAVHEAGHYLGVDDQRIDSVKAAVFKHGVNDSGALARFQLSSMPTPDERTEDGQAHTRALRTSPLY